MADEFVVSREFQGAGKWIVHLPGGNRTNKIAYFDSEVVAEEVAMRLNIYIEKIGREQERQHEVDQTWIKQLQEDLGKANLNVAKETTRRQTAEKSADKELKYRVNLENEWLALHKEHEKLREALNKYIHHLPFCGYGHCAANPCTCGLG